MKKHRTLNGFAPMIDVRGISAEIRRLRKPGGKWRTMSLNGRVKH